MKYKKTGKVACIGTREPSPIIKKICWGLGRVVVKTQHKLHSGNAYGCDNNFMLGGNLKPELVVAHLPWPGYNSELLRPGWKILVEGNTTEYLELAAQYHPAWRGLSRGTKALMARNVGIVINADLVLAAPSNKIGGGGTGHGIRVAKSLGIEVINLNEILNKERLDQVIEQIKTL